jgi:hypothetical protein
MEKKKQIKLTLRHVRDELKPQNMLSEKLLFQPYSRKCEVILRLPVFILARENTEE